MAITRKLYGVESQNPSQVAENKGFVAGLFGLPYSGKSSLLKTLLPKYGPVAALDVAGGLYVLEDDPENIAIWTPDSWNVLEHQIDELEKDPTPFKSIWLDTVSYMQEESQEHTNIHNYAASDKRNRQIAYGESNWDVVQKIHSKLVGLAASKGINVFFVYWSTRPIQQEGGENNLTQRHIFLSPTVSVKVAGILDIVLYVEKTTGLIPYPPQITLDGDQSVETKVRLSPDNPLKKWPNRVQANPTILSDMIDAFKGEVNERYIKP